MPTTYAPNWQEVPCSDPQGNVTTYINASMFFKRFEPQPFINAGGVASVPVWNTFEMSPAEYGIYYKFEWYIENVSEPVIYSLVAGSLPTGLSLTSVGGARGRVDGIPTALGTFNFTLRATNTEGSADHAFTIVVSPLPIGGFAV